MPLQHEIDARIHICWSAYSTVVDIFSLEVTTEAEPLLERLLQIAQPRKTERLDSANNGGIRVC